MSGLEVGILYRALFLLLLCIRVLLSYGGGNAGGGDANGGLAEEVFKPYRAFSARRGITVNEVVLEGIDVHTTLLDYINSHQVTNIVLGASSRNALTLRKFWTHDLPTLINKAAPDFCSVYVISKGKAQSIRPAATRDVANSTTPRLQPPLLPAKSNHFEPENLLRPSPVKVGRKTADSQGVPRRGSRNAGSGNSLDIDSTEPAIDLQSADIMRGQDITVVGKDNDNSLSLSEVLRLKQEMKETMNMYNAACKEAVSAQHRADELQKLKLDEKNRLEQARLAEEAALALVEIEKAKCRAAIEAAEKAQKIAEKEMQRRKQAEQKAKREAQEKYRALDVLSNNDIRYRKYTIDEIQAATDKFSRSMKIGEGGYGPVFKGKLDHTPVAIKVLRPDAAQGRKQFQQEVEVLSCIRHPNMVLLMGACPEYGCLVYEFMDNGSLEDRLFRKGNTPPIPWGIRFKIAADIATGLLFLHQTKPEPPCSPGPKASQRPARSQ
ncbi:UNVERIFIED_CONTAM: U-box domain-containing protein 52 [Sesamum angustifolium]|uniref:RING-type E3 ubiquitin transferase n=1 Tax=Sesamum angustifolium TaxID=2727405 RepID=A0AAW2MJI5_9LAMI